MEKKPKYETKQDDRKDVKPAKTREELEPMHDRFEPKVIK